MNPAGSTTSLNSLLTYHTPNLGKANPGWKLNNDALIAFHTSYLNPGREPGAVASTISSLECRTVSNRASSERIQPNEIDNSVVSEIIEHMNHLKSILIENDEHYGNQAPSPDIEVFEHAVQLLNYLEPCNISKGEEMSDGRSTCGCCEGGSDTDYDVYYKGDVLFTLTETSSETRFRDYYTTGESGAIETRDLFNELYFAPGAPGYQSAKSEFEQCLKLRNSKVFPVAA